MGGYEGADHINGAGLPLDMLRSSGHLDGLERDHAAAAAIGLRTVRESVGWRLCEAPGGKADLRRVVRIAQSARRNGLQVIWTLMHYGTPADLSLFEDPMIERFAAFAATVARALAQVSEDPPIYNPINEMGFLAWAVSATNLVFPYRNESQAASAAAEAQGYAVKQRLVRASLAAVEAIRRVDPRARFLHTEPVVHVVAPADQPQLAERAAQLCTYQWQTWDMLCGHTDVALGGHDAAVDFVGVNHYHSGQWETGTEQRLHWHLRDPRRKTADRLAADRLAALPKAADRRRDQPCRRGPRAVAARGGRADTAGAGARRAGSRAVPVSADRPPRLERRRALASQRPVGRRRAFAPDDVDAAAAPPALPTLCRCAAPMAAGSSPPVPQEPPCPT